MSKALKEKALTGLRKYKPYPAYKDSGVEWLGRVPEGWDIKPLKYAAIICRDLVERVGNEPYVGLEHIESWSGRIILDAQPETVESMVSSFSAGDVLFGKLRPYLAKVVRPCFNGVCTSEIVVMKPTEYSRQGYLFYCFLSTMFIQWMNSLTYGTKMPRVNPIHLGSTAIPLPNINEQCAITDFLNQRTAKIDALIAKQERLIELLQEKRAALITQAVTKGLDPDVPMKDSGVEWLGEVPTHWEVKPLKRIALINPETLTEDTDPDYEFNYIEINGVNSNGTIVRKEFMQFNKAPSRARRKVVQGDTIISTVRTYLKAIALIKKAIPELIVSTGFAVLRNKGEMENEFLWRLVQSSIFVVKVVSHSEGVSYPAITPYVLGTLPIWFPPSTEQKEIILFLDREVGRIDHLTSKANKSIELLNEYRAALISAAVTGKIDVRGEVSLACL